MNAQALTIEADNTDILVAVATNPGVVLLDREKFDAWYEKLSAEAPTDADVSTAKGRDTLRSFAAKVRSEKAAIDKARLRLTKEWRDMTDQANAAGKEIATRLDGLAADVRAPLTAWEEAEKARVDRCKEVIADIHGAAIVTLEDTSETVRERGMRVWAIEIGDDFGVLAGEAEAAKSATISTLQAALARLKKEEADRAELERLRAEAAEREQADRLKREEEARIAAAQEAARREAEEQKAYEERRAAAEKAALEELEREKLAAAQRARDEAEKSAQAERDRVQREHEEALAAERAAAEKERQRVTLGREMLAYIREVVSGRIGGQIQPFGVLLRELESKVVVVGQGFGDMEAEIEQARVDGLKSLNEAMQRQIEAREREEQREAELKAAQEAHERAENKANRTRVKTAAKQAIMTCGVSEDAAQKVVLAIIAGEIPNVTLRF